MADNDTIRLLRECDAGIKMGVSAIDEVINFSSDTRLKNYLKDNKAGHQRIKREITHLLDEYHDTGKEPNPMAKGMSWIKTNMKLAIDDSDSVIADLMTDGCNMGVKSLGRYLNQYKNADKQSKDLTKKLMSLEEELVMDMRQFL